jgi:hypothetical protein
MVAVTVAAERHISGADQGEWRAAQADVDIMLPFKRGLKLEHLCRAQELLRLVVGRVRQHLLRCARRWRHRLVAQGCAAQRGELVRAALLVGGQA